MRFNPMYMREVATMSHIAGGMNSSGLKFRLPRTSSLTSARVSCETKQQIDHSGKTNHKTVPLKYQSLGCIFFNRYTQVGIIRRRDCS